MEADICILKERNLQLSMSASGAEFEFIAALAIVNLAHNSACRSSKVPSAKSTVLICRTFCSSIIILSATEEELEELEAEILSCHACIGLSAIFVAGGGSPSV
jgi:hypothetical protein